MTTPNYWVQNRQDTAQNWYTYNPVLRSGELGSESDTGRAKMGDGTTPWNSLNYWNPAGAAVGADAAPLNSPAFTGTPTAPTASPGTSTTQLATTAFVEEAVSAGGGRGGAVSSVFGRTGAVVATTGDYTVTEVTGAAPLASPTFTGTPAAPTATAGTNTTQLATTAFTTSAVATETSRAETAEALLAPKASPALTGTPTAPTAAALTNNTQVATTAYADAAVAVEKSRAEAAEANLAPLASPTFTGTPSAPTPTVGDASTKIATTEFVAESVSSSGGGSVTGVSVTSGNGFAGTVANPSSTPAITIETTVTGMLKGNGTAIEEATAGTDYLTPSGSGAALTGITQSQVSGSAPLASPAFTGTPTAPTATSGTNTTQLATTAFVTTAADNAVTSAEGYTTTQLASYAPLASPALTGTPTAPTASAGTDTTQIATTAFVANALASVGAGSVSSVSVVSANGFTGSVADDTTTPAITLETTISGILKGNGTAIEEATAGTDYLTPTGNGSALTGITVSQVSGAAPLSSPAFINTPTAPTASAGTDTTQIATTAFVTAAVAAGGGSGAVPGMNVIWMDNEGVSNTGASSVTTEFNTLLSAQNGAPCIFVFGVGTYLWSTAPDALGPDQSVIGLGPSVTKFTWSGSGPLFTITTAAVSGTWDGSLAAGTFSGFTINGPYGTGGTAGFKYGALQAGVIDNVWFYGLDGGCIEGYQVTSGVDWAEEWQITRLNVSGCGATSGYCFQFNSTSFDYSRIDAVVVVEANIDVLALNNSAEMQGLELHLRGNLHGGTSNTGAVISIDRTTSAGTSNIGGGSFLVSMEGDDTTDGGAGTVGHYMIYMGSSDAASMLSAQGTFNVYNAGAPNQGIYNPNNLPLSFSGLFNPSSMLDGEALVIWGPTCLTPFYMGFSTLGTGTETIYNEFADVYSIQLTSGDVTIQFDGASSYVRRYTFLFKNPASGTCTITWPSNWYFSATTKTFSTAASGITKVEALYDPVSDIYYAEVVGSGYTTSGTTTAG